MAMIVDCHVHVSALNQKHGFISEKLLGSLPFRFMRWRLGLAPDPEHFDLKLEQLLARIIESSVDAAVVLAFDAAHDQEDDVDLANTHLYVTNDYVAELCGRNPRMLFGASIHPYRKDAVQELERCAALGAVLIKWLPIVQNFNPADARCERFYEALAALKMPLLCHTGGETSLPNLDKNVADPALLEPALKRGVKVIMAHCGTRSKPWETDFVPTFMQLARQYEHCYGDTSGLNLPTRSYAFKTLMADPVVSTKLVHGSDWPILPVPPLQVGVAKGFELWREGNWMLRDVKIKQALGFDEAYWQRAAKVLGV